VAGGSEALSGARLRGSAGLQHRPRAREKPVFSKACVTDRLRRLPHAPPPLIHNCAEVSHCLCCSVPSNICVVLNFSHAPPSAAGAVRASSLVLSASLIGLWFTASQRACSSTPSLSQPVMVTLTPGTLIA